MKKIRKSLVILPALATMALTTVASVTGTVAWFTASRNTTVTASQFESHAETSSLTVACSGTANDGINTTSTTGNTVVVDGNLTHGSYNAVANATGSLYVASLDTKEVTTDGSTTTTTDILGYRDLGTKASHVETTGSDASDKVEKNKWLAGTYTQDNTSVKVWYGVAWTMTFTYTSNTSGDNYLLFDAKGSTFTDSSSKTTTTAPGFRIAFMTSSKLLVVGGDETKTHTKGTGASDTEEFTDANYIKVGTGDEKYSDDYSSNSSTLADVKTSFGKFDTTTNSIAITCVAWYEGSDSYVANTYNSTAIEMAKIAASLNWYVRTNH